jgi:hypothetical protein
VGGEMGVEEGGGEEREGKETDGCPLTVNTSYITIKFHLCQCDINNPSRHYYNWFCSINLNEQESKYSQPKLKIYRLYQYVLFAHYVSISLESEIS